MIVFPNGRKLRPDMRMSAIFALVILLSMAAAGSSESRLGKCCPAGAIFWGMSTVECAPAPSGAIELYDVEHGPSDRYNGFPRCQEPEDVTMTPLADLRADDFLRPPACLEILHREVMEESVPIVVHCHSSKDDRGERYNESSGIPKVLPVRRCCPRGRVYDPDARMCVEQPGFEETEENDFVSLLPRDLGDTEFLSIVRGPPVCQHAITDHEVSADMIIYENERLRLIEASFKDDLREELGLLEDNSCLEVTRDSATRRKLVVRACRRAQFCNTTLCVRKCCMEDEYAAEWGCTKFSSSTPVEFHKLLANSSNLNSLGVRDYGLLVGKTCQFGMYPITPDEKWHFTPEGYVSQEGFPPYRHHDYCMDFFANSTDVQDGFYPFLCFDDPNLEIEACRIRYTVATILEAISCTFLLITLSVYACLPVLQNLHGKTLMCHVISLLVGYICLATVPWVTPRSDSDDPGSAILCYFIGYTILFSFLSVFFWLNVMCFDIWWTFGGLRGSSTRGRARTKRFLLYCLYAWGLSLLLSILSIVADRTRILPDSITPHIGVMSCWFTQDPGFYGELVFFAGPVTIQLISNLVFFVLTAVHCSKVKAEIKRVIADRSDPRSKRFHADRSKLVMNVKLFVVMGISWVLEVVSFFMAKYSENYFWQKKIFYASDAFNCLQGLMIFVLFVLKPRVYTALRRRLGFDDKKKVGSQATTALQDPYRRDGPCVMIASSEEMKAKWYFARLVLALLRRRWPVPPAATRDLDARVPSSIASNETFERSCFISNLPIVRLTLVLHRPEGALEAGPRISARWKGFLEDKIESGIWRIPKALFRSHVADISCRVPIDLAERARPLKSEERRLE
ncbi:hypothetical protein KM043_004094 [Ampulex compressa]|nr:hypothetical protein KM043_004094 [Ampulex compressa]